MANTDGGGAVLLLDTSELDLMSCNFESNYGVIGGAIHSHSGSSLLIDGSWWYQGVGSRQNTVQLKASWAEVDGVAHIEGTAVKILTTFPLPCNYCLLLHSLPLV